MPFVTDEEARCIRMLADWFEGGTTEVHGSDATIRMKLAWQQFNPLMRKMEGFGAIRILLDEEAVDLFVIEPHVVQLVRELDLRAREAREAPDFVQQIQKRLRQRPVVGWAIIIITSLAVVFSLLADVLGVFERIAAMLRG